MTSFRYDATRAVEIWPAGKGYGTGYRIADRLVLTAKHIFDKAPNGDCEIRCHKEAPNNKLGKVNAKVVWLSPKCDVALIEILEHEKWEPRFLSTRFAHRKDLNNEKSTPFSMFCFPDVLQHKNEESIEQGGHTENGTIVWSDFSSQTDDSIPIRPDSRFEAKSDQSSPWKGSSGASVFCYDMCLGVLKKHINPNYQPNPKVEGLNLVFDDPEWKALLKESGIANYGDNQEKVRSKEDYKVFVSHKLAAILMDNELRESFAQAIDIIARDENYHEPGLKSAESIANHLSDWACDPVESSKNIGSVINKIFVQAVRSYNNGHKNPAKEYLELIGWLLPLALWDRYDELNAKRIPLSSLVLKLDAGSPLFISVVMSRLSEIKVAIERDGINDYYARGAVSCDFQHFKQEYVDLESSKALKDLYARLYDRSEMPEKLSPIQLKDLKATLDAQIEAKEGVYYLCFKLEDKDSDAFVEHASALYQLLPRLGMVAFRESEEHELSELEFRISGAINTFIRVLNRKYPISRGVF